MQNELVLAALKTATDHLTQGGTFCTKVYRSTDYNALMWVFQQLFEEVQAMKPNSSRSQSSEIFIICLRYTAPRSIDAKLLDPNHVFKEVKDPGLQKVDVMHKKYDKLNKRHRTGYDDAVGVLLSSKATVTDYVYSKDPIRLLTDHNELFFSAACEQFGHHPATTDEVRLCFTDLRVLAKLDFKKLLKWRDIMKESFPLKKKSDGDGDDEGIRAPTSAKGDGALDLDEELARLTSSVDVAARREQKKLRQKAAKERQRQALGINNNAFADSHDMELFSLSGIHRSTELDAVHDVDFDDDNDDINRNKESLMRHYRELEDLKQSRDASSIFVDGGAEDLEAELEDQYKRFVAGKRMASEQSLSEEALLRKDQQEETALDGRTKSAKAARLARSSDSLLASRNVHDLERGSLPEELAMYVDVLSGKHTSKKRARSQNDAADNDDSSDDDDDDEEDDGESNPLVTRRSRDSGGVGSAKWFAHPIFNESVFSGDDDNTNGRLSAAASSAIASMPTTDKEKRKEKRKKAVERQERREHRREDKNRPDADNGVFDVIIRESSNSRGDADDDGGEDDLPADVLEHRELIKRGMGAALHDDSTNAKKRKRANGATPGATDVEVVPRGVASASQGQVAAEDGDDADGTIDAADDRLYDSDHEEYDAHDRAMTLALGTLMLRRSKQKALVDASYNRFSWNDSKELPTWFVDDEMKHNKPQLPIPEALMNQIKSRFQLTGTKEIKKVAEARARKRKRALVQLKKAKKQATVMAENSELSEKQKLKAISKAMRTSKVDKPNKVYVVAHKTKGGAVSTSAGAGKGKLHFVDGRMKKDKRALKKKQKGGKKRKH